MKGLLDTPQSSVGSCHEWCKPAVEHRMAVCVSHLALAHPGKPRLASSTVFCLLPSYGLRANRGFNSEKQRQKKEAVQTYSSVCNSLQVLWSAA
jgi:hypothetical protein